MTIATAHLQLCGQAPAHLLALIEGVPQFEKCSGLRAAAGLRDLFTSGDVSPSWLARLHAATAADPWVHGFMIVHRENRMVIGSAGYKGPPDDEGMVEIAYGIVPDYQGRGYATEAAAALVDFAFAKDPVRLVRAHTLPLPNASTRVLAKCGFEHTGEIVDPEDGPVWRWERQRQST